MLVHRGGKGFNAHVAQVVEHFLGKEEVTGSSPVVGSRAIDILVSLGREYHLKKKDLSSHRREWHGKAEI